VFKFITQKPLWVNILASFGILLIVIFIFFSLLDWITGHDKYEKVPAITGQNIDAAKITLMNKGFNVVVSDSVYDNTVGALTVVRQTPEADDSVKYGRTIYLAVNRAMAPQISMPNLIGFSYRSAEASLQSMGLKVADVSYKPDIARNSVLQQLLNGSEIKPGTKLPLGSAISLVLGSGEGNEEINVPDLIGLKLSEARNMLSTFNISLGSIVPLGNVSDTANAFIVKQSPETFTVNAEGARESNKIHQGEVMTVYISNAAPVKDTTQNNP
jgi:beta-lactam-binding protein with PASTA domain